ncbi:ferredoxin [Streptomyces triculaminicus]|uniref:Ferredoxin n=2 Tax=Streptomyces TaxID=1883 RepID=A0A939FNC6_9ACTN|nr:MULTISPECIES: ferredoxin [Streptomyces]MBO0655205.1 ferredoxin [Streptomyces triculaminicus]QSY50933.1 ferredoxin [Streptomyces griseocarneus]
MRVTIDSDICIGSGMCALTAPSVFDQDDDGYGSVRPGREDGAGDPLTKEAARGCPVQAITIAED